MAKKLEFVEVEAEIIEPKEQAIEVVYTPAVISANLDDVEKRIREKIAPFEGAVFTDDMMNEAKAARKAINADSALLNKERIAIAKKYKEPLDAFENRVKQIDAYIKKVSEGIDIQVKDFEQRQKNAKKQRLQEHYEAYAGLLVPVVPFERIFDPKWLNATENEIKVHKSIENIVDDIAGDWNSLKKMQNNITHYAEAEACFFRTLDLASALSESERIDALEAEKQAELDRIANMKAEVESYAQPATIEPDEVKPIVISVSDRQTYRFEVACTPAEMIGLQEYMKANNIRGRMI